jgi:outer membrane protein OmpA-like peptidoglycan-associated protein
MKKTQIIAAYYYIDEVSVMLLEEDQFCDCLIAEERNEYSATIYQKAINLNDKMTVNQMIEAQQLFFAFGKDNLTPVGKESLDLIVSKMKANPALKLEIQGHSDAQEDKVGEEKPAYAKMDSKRVNAVIVYLTENGITEARLIPSGQGSESPNEEAYESDDEDLKMAKNRRVTFKVR